MSAGADTPPLCTWYTGEELRDHALIRSELAWYRHVFELTRERDLAQIEAQRRAADPLTAEAYYGPATETSPAAASPAQRAAAPRPNRAPTPVGAHLVEGAARRWRAVRLALAALRDRLRVARNLRAARRRPPLNKDTVRLNAKGRL